MSKSINLHMSKRAMIELLITVLIFIIELIIGLVIRSNESATVQQINHYMNVFIATSNTFNLFYIMVLVIINTNHIGSSKANKQEEIESQVDENKTDKPE